MNNNYNTADYPDRTTNGGMDYYPWLLNQFHQQSLTNNNRRLLDYVTVHCYSAGRRCGQQHGCFHGDCLASQPVHAGFWDTNYVDPSWINSVIMLIPRLKLGGNLLSGHQSGRDRI